MKVAYFTIFLMAGLALASTLSPALAGDAAALGNEEALLARVETLWQAKKNDDWETVYGMTDQKFRKSVTQNKFLQGKSMVIKGYTISKVEIAPDNQNKGASIVIFKTIKAGMPFEISIREEWLNEEGLWNIKLSDPATPFATMTQ